MGNGEEALVDIVGGLEMVLGVKLSLGKFKKESTEDEDFADEGDSELELLLLDVGLLRERWSENIRPFGNLCENSWLPLLRSGMPNGCDP